MRADSVLLEGPGLHGGLTARLEFILRKADGPSGARLRFGAGRFLSARDLAGKTRRARRSTVLGDPGCEILTPEHLLAALLFFPDLPLDVVCDQAEPPNLDGSALPFRDALSRLAPECAAIPSWREYPSDLTWEHHWGYGHMRVRPAGRFRVRYELDRPPLRQAFVLENPGSAWTEILPARTFAFYREWSEATAGGLMAGAGADSGLLLAESEPEYREFPDRHPGLRSGPFPLLNQTTWRMEAEPVKHKILDLLGDLALVRPGLPALDIEIRNGGHRFHHMLVERLLERT